MAQHANPSANGDSWQGFRTVFHFFTTPATLSRPLAMKQLFLLVLTCALAVACQLNCITGTAPVEERTVHVPPFTAIEVDGAMEVVVEKGVEQEVKVSAPADLIALLDTSVSRGLWHVRTTECWRSNEGFTIHIITPAALSSMEVKGSGDIRTVDVFGSGRTRLSAKGSGSITVDGINEKQLETSISGSGSITVRGTCASLSSSVSGSGDLHARDLVANEAEVKISGSGNAELTAISKLAAKVSGSGTVRYAGKPEVSSKISGSGSVIPVE